MSKLEIAKYDWSDAPYWTPPGVIYGLQYKGMYCAFRLEDGDRLERALPQPLRMLWDAVHPSPVIGDRRYKVARSRMRETERIGRGRKRFERIVTKRLLEQGR